MERVGLIGLGNMGTGMAKNLVKNSFRLMVYDIRDDALREMVELGAGVATSPRHVGEQSDVVFIMYSVNLIKDSVSLLRRSGYEGRERIYNSNFFGSLAIKSIKRSVINIRRSMLGVRCSTFKTFRPPGGATAPVWRNLIRSFTRT